MRQQRQGDLLIEEVEKIPKTAKKLKTNILVEGEATGFAHWLKGKADVHQDKDGTIYFVAKEKVKLIHSKVKTLPKPNVKENDDQHNVQVFKVGIRRVIREREYNPYEKKAREVQD